LPVVDSKLLAGETVYESLPQLIEIDPRKGEGIGRSQLLNVLGRFVSGVDLRFFCRQQLLPVQKVDLLRRGLGQIGEGGCTASPAKFIWVLDDEGPNFLAQGFNGKGLLFEESVLEGSVFSRGYVGTRSHV
jgi:hypothetical protein